MKRLSFVAVSLVIVGAAGGGGLRGADEKEPKHLRAARKLVKNLDLKNTSYEHGKPDVSFTAPYKSHADCSSFLDALLRHSYNYAPEDFKKWFGREQPTAERWHDAIGKKELFEQVTDFRRTRAGDILAIKYAKPKEKNTGHVMLVAGEPRQIKATDPLKAGTDQWEIAVIDSSRSGHGKSDTRHLKGVGGKDHDGLGQGVLRVYTDKDGRVEGYTWSVGGKNFMSQQEDNLVIGRLKPAPKP